MKYILVEVGNPWGAICKVLSRGQWLIPNIGHRELLATEKAMPDEVTFLGDSDDVTDDEVPKTVHQWQCFVYRLSEAAYAYAVNRWEQRADVKWSD